MNSEAYRAIVSAHCRPNATKLIERRVTVQMDNDSWLFDSKEMEYSAMARKDQSPDLNQIAAFQLLKEKTGRKTHRKTTNKDGCQKCPGRKVRTWWRHWPPVFRPSRLHKIFTHVCLSKYLRVPGNRDTLYKMAVKILISKLKVFTWIISQLFSFWSIVKVCGGKMHCPNTCGPVINCKS